MDKDRIVGSGKQIKGEAASKTRSKANSTYSHGEPFAPLAW